MPVTLRALLCTVILLGITSRVLADVVNVVGTVTPNTVALGPGASVVVNWSVNIGVGGGVVTDTVTSNGGTFVYFTSIPSQITLGSNNRTLSRNTAVPNANLQFTEVLQIPASIIYTANKQGQNSFFYNRIFADSVDDFSGLVEINIGSTSGGFLDLSRVSLKFDTNEIVRVSAQDEQLKAIAEINYNGTGLFDAVWEVAYPSSTSGEPMFVPVRVIRQYLGAGRNAILQSPLLPTVQTGLHLVRLRINQPTVSFELPVLQYHVIPDREEEKQKVVLSDIRLLSPLPSDLYESGAEFRWEAVQGASAYQLEIHDIETSAVEEVPARSLEEVDTDAKSRSPQSRPVTGILLPADQATAKLSEMSQQYLLQGHRYQWRVIAINANGAVVAASKMQEIRTP